MGGASRGGSLVLWQVYYGVVSSVFCPRNGLVVVLMGPLLKLSKFYSDGVVVKKGFVVRGKAPATKSKSRRPPRLQPRADSEINAVIEASTC